MGWFNSMIVRSLPYFPKSCVGMVAKRYIAGDTLEKAIQKVQFLNGMGAVATIDLLGESVQNIESVESTIATYQQVLFEIQKKSLRSTISIKPSAFGYLLDKQLCEESIEKIVYIASELGLSVCIDMEDHSLTDFTLRLYSQLRQKYPQAISTVVQSYLKRSKDDLIQLTCSGFTNLRLCKGIYVESSEIAYKDREQVRQNYLALLDFLLSQGAYVGIATHDNPLVVGATQLIEKYQLKQNQYEFQMLLGVRPNLLKRIISKGHPVRVYVPFGQEWYAYSMRRLKENPSIAGQITQSFIPFMTEKLPL